MRLRTDRISFAYAPRHPVLRDVSLEVGDSQVLFVLGANGSGKTTLLQCLSGVRRPTSGTVWIDDRPLFGFTPRQRAQRIGVVPQLHEPAFPFTVAEAVLMGRAPYLGTFARPGREDWAAVDRALDEVGISALRQRPYTEISGGERQLVLIARGLAQGAGFLLMDEPAAHLDPHHQRDVLGVMRDLARSGRSFVVSSHQPEAALLYADAVLFLIGGEARFRGDSQDAITEESLRAAYGMEFEIVQAASGTRCVVPRVNRAPKG